VTGWKASLKAAAVGAMSGTAIGLLSFFFLTSRQYPSMGAALFLLVPVAAGFSIAIVAAKPNRTAAAALLSVVGSLVLLIGLGKEGTLCAILAFPIIIVGLAIGVGIGVLVRKLLVNRAKNQNTTTGMLLLIAPALIFAGERVERPMLQHPRIEVIQSSVEVNDSPERVWGDILSIDSVQASKPLLMYVGLPIPERCTIQGKGVGAKRTCYFNVGYIEETVTRWNPPYFLGLSIDRTHMPGRHWLAFESAEYRLEPSGSMTRLTRSTTVLSYLHPSWYWRRFERLGVESEHSYILRDVVLRAVH
jgi:hypothetical protein